MKLGGPLSPQQTADVLRGISVGTPLLLIIYALMLLLTGLGYTAYASGPGLLLLTIGGFSVTVGVHLYATNRSNLVQKCLLAYLVLMLPCGLFVSGLTIPFIIGWVLLLLNAYRANGTQALCIGLLILFLVGFIETSNRFWAGDSLQVMGLLFGLVFALLMVVMGILLYRPQSSTPKKTHQHADITAGQNKFSTIINNMTDAVIATDGDGKIELYNAAALNLLDTNETLTGRPIDEVMRLYTLTHTRAKLATRLRQSRPKPRIRDDLLFKSDEGDIRIEMKRIPIRSGFRSSSDRTHDYIFTFRDITHAKSVEEEKDEFISIVSHELRTPLAIAEGTLSNLLVMMTRKDVAQKVLAQNTEAAHEQVIFLAKMVNDLSTLSRAERGVADAPERIDVQELIQDMFREYEPRASRKGLALNLAVDPHPGYVSASPLYLKELLQNFMTNALKYTKKGSITLMVEKVDRGLRFSVIDTGIGISRNDQAKIFEKFYRSEDYRTRETRGTGLGLYVATKLAMKLGTTINLTSRLNHGSEFSFILPSSSVTKKSS